MSDDYTPYQLQQEWLTGKKRMSEHPYATLRTEKLLTADQETKLRMLFKMMNLGPDDSQVRELQLVVGLQPTPYGWRLANRKQAAQMIGMMVNYARDMERERASLPSPGKPRSTHRGILSNPGHPSRKADGVVAPPHPGHAGE